MCAGKMYHARRNTFVTESLMMWYACRWAITTETKTMCVVRVLRLFSREQIPDDFIQINS